MLALLPAESPSEPSGLREVREVLWREETNNAEGIDSAISAAQVRSVASLGNLPLVVLTRASEPWIRRVVTEFPGFPQEVAATLEQAWQEQQHDLLRLSSRSRQ